MDFFEFINKHSLVLGVLAISLGIVLLSIKIISINNEKLHQKFKNSEFNEAAFWSIIAGSISLGLKLIFTGRVF
jgi:uncharacterized membrane protein (DUF441 family)